MTQIKNKYFIVIGIIIFFTILSLPCFFYEPLNLWIRYSILKTPSGLYEKAEILFDQKDYDEAKYFYWQSYTQAKKQKKSGWLPLYRLMKKWYELKRYDDSILAAETYLRDLPNNHLSIVYLGKNYEALKNYEKAFSYYINFIPCSIINTKHNSKEVAPKFFGKNNGDENCESYEYDDIVFRLAIFYTFGQGCDIDLTKAANLWQYLDNHKSPNATYNLALCYLYGHGVAVSDVRAFQLCKKAADRGCKSAMKLLAKLYRNGKGCAKSEDTAKHWETLAEESQK